LLHHACIIKLLGDTDITCLTRAWIVFLHGRVFADSKTPEEALMRYRPRLLTKFA
jgi:hypothetical protein